MREDAQGPGVVAGRRAARRATALVALPGPNQEPRCLLGGAFYQVSLTGGGYEQLSQIGSGHHRVIGIDLFSTTASSQLTITLKSAQPAFGSANTVLQIGKINVHSGQLGGINAAGAANLLGNVTTLKGSVQTIAFNDLGPNAQINVVGSVGTFQVGSADLSANGLVNITGDVTGQFSAGGLDLNGGRVIIGDNVDGGLSLGGLDITQGGQLIVGNNLDGASTLGPVDINGGRFLVGHNVNGTLTTGDLIVQNAGHFIVNNDAAGLVQVEGVARINSNGLVQVGGTLAGLNVFQGLTLDSSGKLSVGSDVTGPITVGTGVSLSNNAQITVGRDILGTAAARRVRPHVVRAQKTMPREAERTNISHANSRVKSHSETHGFVFSSVAAPAAISRK